MIAYHVLVMAKSPVPGRVKTRMCPPLSAVDAAGVAQAALEDTLDAMARCGADRRIVALDGEPGPWLPPGFEVIAQCGHGLDERLAHAWEHAGGPGFQIGMDTPQVTGELLDSCLEELASPGATAVLGPAYDGGWWSLGLHTPEAAVFAGVPMSTASTGREQLGRLIELGHDPVILPTLRDVDLIEDAAVVADLVPASRFARAIRPFVAPACGS